MSEELTMPHRVTIMGMAMRPVLRKLMEQINQSNTACAPDGNMIDLIIHYLRLLQIHVNHLKVGVDALMSEVVENTRASDSDVQIAVNRFNAAMVDMAQDYRSIGGLAVTGEDLAGRDLLAGIYRHTLQEVARWLADLTSAIADPLAALVRLGLPTTGDITLPLTLKMTPAPQTAALVRWGRSRTAHLPPDDQRRMGFWQFAGNVTLGAVLGGLMFG
jgi:hypothetical protein